MLHFLDIQEKKHGEENRPPEQVLHSSKHRLLPGGDKALAHDNAYLKEESPGAVPRF